MQYDAPEGEYFQTDGFYLYATTYPIGYEPELVVTEEDTMKIVSAAIALAVICLVNPAAHAQMEPAKVANTAKGKALVDSKGMTLYIFDKDAGSKSNCNGKCAVNWPPLLVATGAKASGDWSIVTRADGGKQWAYKGKPLYGWIKDKKAGDVTGDGVNNVWHIARP